MGFYVRKSLKAGPFRFNVSWRGRVGAALVLASAALCGSVPVAAASSSDAQATHAYLIAQYKLVTALLHDAPAVRGAESTAATQIARECPGVVSGMPQEPSLVPGTPTPCQGRKRPPEPATADDRGGARYGGRPARHEPVSRGRGSLGRRSTPAVVEQPGDHLGRTGRDHGQARNHLRPRSAVLRRREGVGPERLSRPVGGQPGIRSCAGSAEELRTGGGVPWARS